MARKRARADANRSYSMPEMSELFGRPPYFYREVEQLLVVFETDPAVLRALVPAPLVPNHDNTMFLSVAEFLCSGFGRYLEMHLFTQATFKRRLVNYSLYLILDNDVAICGGRGFGAFPEIRPPDLRHDGTTSVRATVGRGGISRSPMRPCGSPP